MKKIVVAGFTNVKNFGDPIIFKSTEYIINLIAKDKFAEIEELDLIGSKIKHSIYIRGCIKILRKILNIGFDNGRKNSKSSYYLQRKIIEIETKNYYKEQIKGADGIIFAGGGLVKYKYETCDFRITILKDLAEKMKIPIALNAVGIEDYSTENFRCQKLKKEINSDIIKSITTRDDIDLLNEKYIVNKDIYTKKVADPAFWVDQVYNISKDEKSETIGIGIVRGKIFIDNGINYTEEEFIDLISNIIKELDSRKIKWKIFTNGSILDSEFLEILLKKIGRLEDKDNISVVPKTPQELVKIISSFKKIIACRLHASIIAYSLEIPSVGLIWNDKLKMFGKIINHPERFIEHKDFDAKVIVDKMVEAKLSEEDIKHKNEYRKTTLNSLKRFFESIHI